MTDTSPHGTVRMGNPQYINNATFQGADNNPDVQNLNPGTQGVDFNEPNSSVLIPFTPGITPILSSVSVPPNTSNVDSITVI
ncbi:unnamed protein product, partial [Adineta ricciae]